MQASERTRGARSGGVLIYRLGSLGDTVVALPAFHWIRNQYCGERITALTNQPVHSKAPPLASVLENTGLVDDFMSYPVELRRFAELKRLRDAIAARRFHTVISLTASRGLAKSLRDWFFFRWCGAQQIIGIPFRRADLQCHRNHGSGFYVSEAQRLLHRLPLHESINWEADKWWDLHLTRVEEHQAQELLDQSGVTPPFLAVSVGTKVEAKDWGEENWRALMRRIADQFYDLALVAVGATEESARSERLLALWPGIKANYCGRTSPRISAAVLKRAALFLGHDSGPMHLAASVGTECVAIFTTHARPGQWFPRGRQHTVLYHQPQAKRSLTSITVGEVLGAVAKHLARHHRTETRSVAPELVQGRLKRISVVDLNP